MQTNSEKRNLPISVGVTTMIVVLFICTLTMIAVFGLRSVYDRNIGVMAEVSSTKQYYKANGEAYEKLEYISNIVVKKESIDLIGEKLINDPTIMVENKGENNTTISYMVNINESQHIIVKLNLNHKAVEEGKKENMLQILEWRILNE